MDPVTSIRPIEDGVSNFTTWKTLYTHPSWTRRNVKGEKYKARKLVHEGSHSSVDNRWIRDLYGQGGPAFNGVMPVVANNSISNSKSGISFRKIHGGLNIPLTRPLLIPVPVLMADSEGNKTRVGIYNHERNGHPKAFDMAFKKIFVHFPSKLQNHLKSQLKRLAKGDGTNSVRSELKHEKGASTSLGVDLEKQLQAWRENPSWVDQTPEIKVSVPKGSLCNLNVNVNVGLPPDAVYNIVTDPDNKRVFKNIKEVISRKVLVDEGLRQVVELEQAAIWKFLWWSGTIAVHVLVDQNRVDHSMKFKQLKTGFMKKFEGSWKVEPLFVDERTCLPFEPKTWTEYESCTGGKGRIGSKVSLDQLIQPAIVPPPPISWYLRGITSRTTEMLINDLLAEAARIRGDHAPENLNKEFQISEGIIHTQVDNIRDIKERWALRRRSAKQCHRKRITAE
ncbi:hypothetical protein FNV43_RR25984 [Rhamnella rubrinervis]|uniref:DUF220 domain-containing protein n=1 Tax=Rhamnella rubrinervis TaxID=2594499 RepID=A0A8K0DNF2_9ROSA|nr:hypothetical protein FNV43_RR25984 [Rhamnella rubrinervis]